jgi:hypothetical protein
MKANRVIGALWMLLGCYSMSDLPWSWLATKPPPHVWYALAICSLIYLVGILAGVCLFCGLKWARWLLCLTAAFVVFGSIVKVASSEAPLAASCLWHAALGVFALVLLVPLFLPCREPVA